MQYDKNEFIYYYNNYLDIKSRIEGINGNISELLEDDELKEIVDFYNHLNNQMKKRFNRIMHHNNFVRYKLKVKMIEEFEKSLDKLYQDFIKSKAFPFSKDEFHFFVSSDTYLVDAINDEDSKDFSEEENKFISDCITDVYKYNPNDYTKNDITLIKVLFLIKEDFFKGRISFIYNDIVCYITRNVFFAKLNDEYKSYLYGSIDKWKIKALRNNLNCQQKIILKSDSDYKELLLFSVRTAFYELELLDGKNVGDIIEHLEDKDIKNEHQKRKQDFEIDSLIKAYYNLMDNDFRDNSGYFRESDKLPESEYIIKFETANPKVNERILKMKRR